MIPEPRRASYLPNWCGSWKPTRGYGVAVKTAYATNDGRCVVEYVETAPEPGQVVTQALTTPWVVALVPCSKLPVVFKKVER